MLSIFNDLTRKKEVFQSIEPKKVKMYVCGPTVYDECHIGHARSFVMFDIVRRYLEYLGYETTYVMNFTDVDDKMIKRAREEGLTIFDLAERYIKHFHEDMSALNVKPATFHPRATECIPEMIKFIEILLEKGHAYRSNGNIYFDVRSIQNYGALSGNPLPETKTICTKHPGEKRSVEDFALWKQKKESEPAWQSPWGEGRPGWHLECSTMCLKYLAETIDIHGGGRDLIFPHHENEIAQSEAANGKKFVNFWLHNGFVNINKEKMSKSLGNFLTIKQVLEKYHPMVIRLFLLSAHYRRPLNYEPENIIPFKMTHSRFTNALQLSAQIKEGEQVVRTEDPEFENVIKECENEFLEAMNDDFNTPLALVAVQRLAKEINQYSTAKEIPPIPLFRKAHELLTTFGEILGINEKIAEDDVLMEPILEILLDVRNELRKTKNYKLADEIRDRLKAIGIKIDDFAGQTKWTKD
ncbi:MAG: cysteine--tRNA ligase [Candidatus Helarchaeota archaeon]